MNKLILIQIFYSIICLLEAYLEKVVIALKNPAADNYTILNNQEHTRSAIYSVSVAISLIIATMLYGRIYWQMVVVLALMLFIRRIWFDTALKFLRNIKIRENNGTGNIDKAFRFVFRKDGGWRELAACILIVAIVNFLMLKYGN